MNFRMPSPLLFTKLYIAPPRPNIVLRPRLIERLNEGLSMGCKLTLISASAGFGKTTLVSEWIASCERPVAWLSLDEGDNDPVRFISYLVAALQTIKAGIGEGLLAALQSPQPPSTESVLTALLNEITTVPDNFILVLDDYHIIDSKPVDKALTFLLEHLPPGMNLVIATREDPHLPLARLRARGQLTELRAADLRFTSSESADFLNQVMGLNLSVEDIAALETRTEGWIAGLQFAALSMQGHHDTASFIQSFTGSHHFVLDYLMEEVLGQQSEGVQTFLLVTSILDRMCGSLCDAVLLDSSASGQKTLEYLERANLFVVPLDDERHWFRYHHLFSDLLRQRIQQSKSSGNEEGGLTEYHIRASQWYEDNGLDLEAFQHAAAANDIERAERLIEGDGIPLHFQGAVAAIMDWLASLPKTIMDSRPSLSVRYATLSLVAGQTTGLEEKLQMAEAAIQGIPSAATGMDDKTRNLIGQIASARARLAVSKYQIETIFVQARRALEYLPHDSLVSRFRASWSLAYAHHFRGERTAAARVCAEALSIAEASGNILDAIIATLLMGQIQQLENQLHPAFETFRRCLRLLGDNYPPPSTGEAYRGLATIYYEWNNLDAAEHYGQWSLQLLRQYDRIIDRFIISEVFLARLKLARGDVAGAATMLAETEQSVRQNNFVHRIPEVAAAQVLVLLRKGDLVAAAQLAKTHELPLSQARVHLAQGDPSAALAVLKPFRRQMEAKDWQDERLKAMVLQAVALHTKGEKDQAVQVLGEALALAETGGFIRIFVDEGLPMAQLLSEAAAYGMMPDYIGKLLTVFETEKQKSEDKPDLPPAKLLIEPLSQRELEVLQLIAQGLSNHEICERLFLALDTVKGHNRKIFDKLQVHSRTKAVARAHELGLL
jgi:LuxR family maltose regulon positive regulatory protein